MLSLSLYMQQRRNISPRKHSLQNQQKILKKYFAVWNLSTKSPDYKGLMIIVNSIMQLDLLMPFYYFPLTHSNYVLSQHSKYHDSKDLLPTFLKYWSVFFRTQVYWDCTGVFFDMEIPGYPGISMSRIHHGNDKLIKLHSTLPKVWETEYIIRTLFIKCANLSLVKYF